MLISHKGFKRQFFLFTTPHTLNLIVGQRRCEGEKPGSRVASIRPRVLARLPCLAAFTPDPCACAPHEFNWSVDGEPAVVMRMQTLEPFCVPFIRSAPRCRPRTNPGAIRS